MYLFNRLLPVTILSIGLLGLVGCTQTDAASSPSSGAVGASVGLASTGGVVARVDGKAITSEELDAEVQGQLVGLRVQAHDVRSKGLDKMIDDRLLEAEAARRGVTTEELVNSEVTGKLSEVSDAEARAYFDSKVPPNSKAEFDTGPRPVKGRIKQILAREQETALRQALITGLRDSAGVEVLLEPLRFDVGYTDINPSKGDTATAPVVIVIFSEFACPYCSRVLPTMEKVEETYGDQVAMVFRDYPLPMHKDAPKAAEAGHCAHEQGKFWELHDVLFQNQKALKPAQLKGYAATVGLDQAAFDECLDSGRHAATVEADTKAGAAVGVRGTPAFFVNGQFINGAQPFENFQKVIDAELKAKGLQVKSH